MKNIIGICGEKNSGKTLIIIGIMKYYLLKGYDFGAFKPIDKGESINLSKDLLSDGELFKKKGQMKENINIINPYMLHEQLPPVLAAKRDGIKISKSVLNACIKKLKKNYKILLVEGPHSLRTPYVDNENWINFIRSWCDEVIWISKISENSMENTLNSFEILKKMGIKTNILLNNQSNELNLDLIQYQWSTFENELSIKVHGFVPYIKSENKFNIIQKAIEGFIEKFELYKGLV